MSNRMLQVNELLRQELAMIVSQEIHLENGLITITKVKCSPDLKRATVLISVLPENISGTALNLLKKTNHIFNQGLKGKLDLKTIPRFFWRIDEQERYAMEMDKIFDEIKKNETE